MEDIKNPLRNLMILVASFLVLGQVTLTSPLEENLTSHCAYNTASVMEPQEKLESAYITPENVKSSKLCKEYFSIVNVIKKVEASESTKSFLMSILLLPYVIHYCVNRDCSIRNILQLAIQVSGSILSYIFPTNQQITLKNQEFYQIHFTLSNVLAPD
jgi:hypothetical protein